MAGVSPAKYKSRSRRGCLYRLFSDNCERNPASMRCNAVFEEKNSLPGSALHFSIHDRDRLARSRQNHADMRGHVIAAFRAVRKILGVFRHEAVEEFLEVAPRGWIGIFHNNHTATGVLNKDRDRPAAQTALVDPSLDIIGHFIRSLAIGAEFKLLVVDTHNGLRV
jgi:hypothetical protein